MKAQATKPATAAQVRAVLAELERLAQKRVREDMPKRYGIHAKKAFGVPMSAMQRVAKSAGRSHELALALWQTGWYEARTVAAFVDEPERVTPAQMDAWCRDFDNWGICDTVCFKLFDQTPHAFAKIAQWAHRKPEFEKRAAFALLASVAGHDKTSGDEPFLKLLPLVEQAADDERNFVKKGVSWALRMVGRRSPRLYAAATALARRLAASKDANERWLGKDALRDLERPVVARKMKAKGAAG
jgi:3-methyladenine DNA glycosylase AlkD